MIDYKKFSNKIKASKSFTKKVLENGVVMEDYNIVKSGLNEMYDSFSEIIKDEKLKKELKLKLLFAFSFGNVIVHNNHFIGKVDYDTYKYYLDIMIKEGEEGPFIVFRTIFKDKNEVQIKEIGSYQTYLDNSYSIVKEYNKNTSNNKKINIFSGTYDEEGKIISKSSKRKNIKVLKDREVVKERNYDILEDDELSLKHENKSNLLIFPLINDCQYNETNKYYKKDLSLDSDYEEITDMEYNNFHKKVKIRGVKK